MATYGSRDRNLFRVPETYKLNGVDTPTNIDSTKKYYTLVDSQSGEITIKEYNGVSSSVLVLGTVGQDRTVGTIPKDGVFQPNPNSQNNAAENKYFSSAVGQKSVKNYGVITAQNGGEKNAQQLIFPNSAATTTPKAKSGTGDQQGALTENEANYIKSGKDKIASREDYGNTPIVYPEGLKLNYQDCIKFSIVKYKQTGLKGFGEGDRNLRRVVVEGGIPKSADKKRTILGTIVLPIPGGIQDSNRVVWSGSEPLYDPQGAAGKLVQTALQGGDVTKKAEEQFNRANISDLRKAIITKTIEGAINSGGLMQREFGAIINPNLELLFNSPDLRQFSFSFKLSPRSKSEAEIVRKIIRSFKQAMSVKRSASSFLLQTPHTFAISYIFKNENHPYLNKFKECALTSCNVNYTPEATYMSFEDGAMVSYQVDLTFQELEPIYDDDYTEIDRDKDDYIGY
jgi:hypothetical protein